MRMLIAALLLSVAGCSGDDGDSGDAGNAGPTTGPPPTSAATTAPATDSATPSLTDDLERATGPLIEVRSSAYGPMLFDGRGQAIYLFDQETTRRPRCYGECEEVWPPVLTEDSAVPGHGVRARLLGATTRKDGSRQVTYNGHPLYFYAHERPGQVLCHDVFENGGYWYVVQPDGSRAP